MTTRFGEYEIDRQRFELRRGGHPVPVERRVFDLILYLVANATRVIPKAELLRAIWPGRHVTEGSLSVAIAAARRAMGDDAAAQRVIRTCRGRGYQFVLTSSSQERGSDLGPGEQPDRLHSLPDLVGRRDEFAVLANAANRLADGASSIILISGEPGIGKTRLLDEFLRIANALGLATAVGGCPESGDAPAMWPWSQILRHLHRTTPKGALFEPAARHIPAISMVAPELLSTHQEDQAKPEASEVASFQLYEGLLEALEYLVTGKKVVIALDDLHRADASTLGFFRFAVRELRHLPLVFLGTHRISELRHTAAHTRILAELAREPWAVPIRLEGLGPQDTTLLFERLTSRTVSRQVSTQVFEQTGGNPFFISQIAVLAATSPSLGQNVENRALPPTIRDAILEQIAGLSETARVVLSAASVVGRFFSAASLQAFLQLSSDQFHSALDELIDSFVVQRDVIDSDRHAFAHVLVRDALYDSKGLSERRRLHDLIGRSLAAQHSTASEENAAEIAYHFFEARTAESLMEARSLSEVAARAASARSAHDDACRHYLRALQALDLTESANAKERCRLLLALGSARCRAGMRSEAKQTFAIAASLARGLGAAEDLARAALGVAPGFLAVEVGVSDAFLEDLLQESLDNLGARSPHLRARIAARLAMALHWTNAHRRMHDVLAIARSISERLDDPAVSLDVTFARWFCEWNHAESLTRDRVADEVQMHAETLRNREMTLVGTMLRQVGMLERGETALFDVSLERFAAMAALLRQPYSLWYDTLYRSMRELLAGRLSLVPELLLKFQSVAARVEDANAMNSLIMQYSFFRWETGDLEPMIDSIVDGAQRSPTLHAFRAAVAWANCKVGKIATAKRGLDALASARFADFPERFDWPISVSLCAEVSCDLGDAGRARILYELLHPLEGRFIVLGLGVLSFGSADRLLGRLSETVGQSERAEAHYRVALERNAAAGAHAWTAHTKLDYALLLARAGGSSRRDFRVHLASEALETANDLGMVSLRARAESFLQGSGTESVGRSPS